MASNRKRLDKYDYFLFISLAAIVALFIFLMSGCRTVKTKTITVHDTITIQKEGKTEYLYKDTGSKVTEYLPYFLTVNDTVIQPIFRTIEKQGKTIYKKDTLYIREKYYVNKEIKSVDKKPQPNRWVLFPILLLLILIGYFFYKQSKQ